MLIGTPSKIPLTFPELQRSEDNFACCKIFSLSKQTKALNWEFLFSNCLANSFNLSGWARLCVSGNLYAFLKFCICFLHHVDSAPI